jgi:PBP1b-binding outer membrane lipoprotein LpoB
MNKAIVIGAIAATSFILVACQQPAKPAAEVQTPPAVTTPVQTPAAVTTPVSQTSSSAASLSILPAGETAPAVGNTQTATSSATLSIDPSGETDAQSVNVDAKLEIKEPVTTN